MNECLATLELATKIEQLTREKMKLVKSHPLDLEPSLPMKLRETMSDEDISDEGLDRSILVLHFNRDWLQNIKHNGLNLAISNVMFLYEQYQDLIDNIINTDFKEDD